MDNTKNKEIRLMQKNTGKRSPRENPHFVEKLDNGVTLLLYPRTECLTAAFGVFHGLGAANESVKRHEQGIAHVIEHMTFKSSEFRTTKQLGDSLSAIGAETNAYTDWDSTVFYARVPHQNLRRLIDLMGEMILHPKFNDSELETEKGAIVSEIRSSEDSHDTRTIEIARGNLFPATSRQRGSIIGLERDVMALKGYDIRFWKDVNYTPGKTVIVAVGKFDPKAVIDQVNGLWGELSNHRVPRARFGTGGNGTPLNVENEIRRDTQQAHISQVGHRVIPYRSPESYAQVLMMQVYGAGTSSRLFHELREKRGLCYSCAAWSTWYGGFGDVFSTMYVGTSEKDIKKVRDLIASIQEGLAGKHVGKAELDRARNECIGQSMITHDSLINYLRNIGESYLQGHEATSVEHFVESISAVTAQQVREAAELTFFKTDRSTTVCLPNEAK